MSPDREHELRTPISEPLDAVASVPGNHDQSPAGHPTPLRPFEFRCGRRPRNDDDLVHIFGLPYRMTTSGPQSTAVVWEAMERAWDRGERTAHLDLDAWEAAAERDAGGG